MYTQQHIVVLYTVRTSIPLASLAFNSSVILLYAAALPYIRLAAATMVDVLPVQL